MTNSMETTTADSRIAKLGIGFIVGVILFGLAASQFYWYLSVKADGFSPRLGNEFFLLYSALFIVGVYLIYVTLVTGVSRMQ